MKAAKPIAIVVGGLVALNLLVLLVATQLRSPTGPRSSSYATSPAGVAAYASLLEEFGYETERYRRPLGDEPLDPSATVVLLDPPSVPSDATTALGEFLEDGGRLVAGGADPLWLERVVADAPAWSPSAPKEFDSPDLGEVVGAAEGAWTDEGAGRAVVGDAGSALVVEVDEGAGTALLLADVSPLQNRLLDQGGNAALGLQLAGPSERPVVFVESVHGYGLGTGLAALPSRWKWTLAGLGLAAAVWLWARAMRLGPPEQRARALPPPRRAYVEALAATLARTDRARRGNP